MKVYLINRRDVAVFQGEKQLCVKRKGGAEFVEPVAADGEEVTLRFYRRSVALRYVFLDNRHLRHLYAAVR